MQWYTKETTMHTIKGKDKKQKKRKSRIGHKTKTWLRGTYIRKVLEALKDTTNEEKRLRANVYFKSVEK